MASWMTDWSPTRYPGIFEGKGANKGSYRVRVRVVSPSTGKPKEGNRVYSGITIKEAVGKQFDLREELLHEATEIIRPRIGDFAKSWIESKAAIVSEYTLSGYVGGLEKHVLPVLGEYYYDAVGHLEVQRMVNSWLGIKKENGTRLYSVRSIKDWFWVFRNMTRDAMAQLGLQRDPTLRISFGEDPIVDVESTQTAKLTIAESATLLEAMRVKRPASYALLQTKKLTGQRFCHVSALKWGDIDWAEMVIRFRRKQVRGVVGPISRKKPVPKQVPILPELAAALIAHGKRNGKLGYGVGLDDWIFPSRTGTLKQPSSLVNAIRRSAKAAKLQKRITPHMMRYLFNDVLRMAGVDQVTRKALTGHVTDEMTEHYSSVQLDEKRAAMEAAGAKLRGVSGDIGGDRPKNKEAA